MLEQAVTQLSDHWRTAFVLRDIVGSSTTDAARVVGAHQAAFKAAFTAAACSYVPSRSQTLTLTRSDGRPPGAREVRRAGNGCYRTGVPFGLMTSQRPPKLDTFWHVIWPGCLSPVK